MWASATAALGARGGAAAPSGPPAPNPLTQLALDRRTLSSAPLGAYVVRVNVHEVAEIVAMDMSGTSDPFVVVSVADQVQRTEVVKQVRSAQFTDTFLFELNIGSASELELQSVTVTVMDANAWPFPDKVIGSYEMELGRVYCQPRHEVHDTWLALASEKRTVNGFVRVSVLVLAPGEEPPDHEEEDAAAAGGDDGDDTSLAVVTPLLPTSASLEEWQLRVLVERAEGLPGVDPLARLTGGAGVNPYARVAFGVAGDVRTAVATPATCDPVWAEELLLPLELPALGDSVRVEVFDHDYGRPDTLLGAVRLSLAEVRAGLHGAPRWHALYGPARGTPAAEAAAMARGAAPGTSYCGRVLLSATAERCLKGKRPKKSAPGHGKRTEGVAPPEAPPEATQRLRLEVFEGFGLPNAGAVRCAVSFGHARTTGHAVDLQSGALRQAGSTGKFLQALTTEAARWPEDPAQCPDALVELWDVPATRLQTPLLLYYARCSAADLLRQGGAPPVRWLELVPGPGVTRGIASAWLQVRVALQRGKAAREPRPADAVLYPLPTARYRLRATLYMARYLPSGAGETAADPYCVLRGAAPPMHTSTRRRTICPTWMEPLMSPVTLPADLSLAPPLSLLVMDHNDFAGHTLLAFLDVPVAACMRDAGAPPPTPQWYDLKCVHSRGVRPAEKPACLLASFELWPLSDAPPPPLLRPRHADATLFITAIGLRGPLAPLAGLPVLNPSLQFSISAAGEAPRAVEMRSSGKANGDAANFFRTDRLVFSAPLDATFAPTLRIDVFDNRPLGMRPLVGSAFVPLEQLLLDMRGGSKPALPDVRVDMGAPAAAAAAAPAPAATGAPVEAWRKDRECYDCELEQRMPLAGFTPFVLHRYDRSVGTFKGLLRIGAAGDDTGSDVLAGMRSLMTPAEYVVRVYAIAGRGLMPPPGLQPGDLAPFVRIRIAGRATDTRRLSDALRGSPDPQFRACLELRVTLPGRATLSVEVLHDGGAFAREQLVGRTDVDLEDRLFSPAWRAVGFDHMPPMVPLEARTLFHPGVSGGARGRLDCMVEILPAAQAHSVPQLPVGLPPPEPFVFRLVVWGTRKIPLGDALSDKLTKASDLFVRATLDGLPPNARGAPGSRIVRLTEETDTHWRVRHGEGSFNWRMVFPIELPWKQARLTLQVWDNDLITPNDHIGETVVNIEGLLTRALTRYRASGGGGSGAVEHFPDPGSSNKPKELGAPGTNEHLAKAAAPCGLFAWLCHLGSGAYARTRGMVAEKGKGNGEWIEMTRVVKGKKRSAGFVSVSITVLHASVAERMPAGLGRNAPNLNPALPPPTRFHFNILRPDLLLLNVLGPELFTQIVVIILVVAGLYVFVADGPLIVTILASKGIGR